MDAEKFEIWMMAYLSDELDAQGRSKFERFLVSHPEYQSKLDELKGAWEELEGFEIPDPSEKMDRQFYAMLREAKSVENSRTPWFDRLNAFIRPLLKPQLAYGIMLLVVGLLIGYFLKIGARDPQNVASIVSNSETELVRGKLVLTLLEQPSANQRLQGVNEANNMDRVDEKVILALLQTLNNDSNVNVRLAAIESLTNYVDNALVREGLVQSIVHQESSLVQVTLANLMVAMQEKKAIGPLKALMGRKALDTIVKQKLELSIQQII